MIGEAAEPALARDGDGIAVRTAVRLDQRRVGPGPGHLLGPVLPGRRAGRGRLDAVRRRPRPGTAVAGHDHRPAWPADRPPRPGRSAPAAPGGRACGRTARRPARCPRRSPPGYPVTSDGGDSGTVPPERAGARPEPGTTAAGQPGPGAPTGAAGRRRPSQRMAGRRAHHPGQLGHHGQARREPGRGGLGSPRRRLVIPPDTSAEAAASSQRARWVPSPGQYPPRGAWHAPQGRLRTASARSEGIAPLIAVITPPSRYRAPTHRNCMWARGHAVNTCLRVAARRNAAVSRLAACQPRSVDAGAVGRGRPARPALPSAARPGR